ncbi:hypothetical protein [Salicibibacter kimchii]|uniref:hypothetical protein n=1 Tax=Salicibibacter kimchii TaxID=2099786 RepID=UPI003AADCED0
MKVANQRRDFLHKQSYHLSKTYKFVFVEDLKIQNMVMQGNKVDLYFITCQM